MNVRVFNLCLFMGWLLVLVGGVIVHPGWGLAIAGTLLIFLTLSGAYLGGLFAPKSATDDKTKGETA